MKIKGKPFVKMHGLGNDFVVLEAQKWPEITPLLARAVCDRRLGVGADQLLVLRPEANVHAHMEIWNPDGSRAEMCGNGIRAVALYLRTHGLHGVLVEAETLRIQTVGGLKSVIEISPAMFEVDMGVPRYNSVVESLSFRPTPASPVMEISFLEVNMGNPHAVVILPVLGASKVEDVPLELWGAAIEHHGRFPNRTNVEFVEITGSQTAKVRVWERGAGATLACGTGACAVAVAALILEKLGSNGNEMVLDLPGGKLHMKWTGPGHSVLMTGPAQLVFEGHWVSENH